MDVPQLAERFLDVAKRHLQLEKLLPGLDKPAWEKLDNFYEVGQNWNKLSTALIPASLLQCWIFEAAKKTEARDLWGITIPLDVIEEEVHKRFPGRWQGSFEVGQRGPVFFREDSHNPTSAVVTEAGMICFSTEKLFYSWRDISDRAS
jgi:hypothetical protein